MQFNDNFHPCNNQIQSAMATGKQVSIRSEIHNIWRPLSLLFKHWKKININRLINTGINTSRAKARSLNYLNIYIGAFTSFRRKRWRSSEFGGGQWRNSVAVVGGGRWRSVEVDVRVSCGVVWCSGVVVV